MPPTDTHQLADHLVALAVDRLEQTATAVPGLALPHTYAGHAVGDDARAAYAWCLGALLELGVDEVAGVDLRARTLDALLAIPPTIEGFGSWWYGESLLRLGGLDAIDDPERAIETLRSPGIASTIAGPDNFYPANWTFVVTRGLVALERLTGERPPELDEWIERCRVHLTSEPTGWIDELPPRAQFDVYTLEIYVLATALLAELESEWRAGLGAALDLLDPAAHPAGAVSWGRSIGCLSPGATMEVGAYALAHGVIDGGSRWAERLRLGAEELVTWLPNGITSAHQHRTPMWYRGPSGRLGLSFDLVGKIAVSALALRGAPAIPLTHPGPVFPPTDELIHFAADSPAGLWAHRNGDLDFVLPFLQGFSIDYGPAPRSPGLFEIPTTGHPCFVPFFHTDVAVDGPLGGPSGSEVRIPAGIPTSVERDGDAVVVVHDGWAAPAQASGEGTPGRRTGRYRVDGTTLSIEEELQIADETIDQVVVLVPETPSRPLDVAVDAVDAALVRIDTAGIAEWRSFWGELRTVHQITVPLDGGRATFRWSIDAST